jgi:hypothetical protein
MVTSHRSKLWSSQAKPQNGRGTRTRGYLPAGNEDDQWVSVAERAIGYGRLDWHAGPYIWRTTEK